jgi:hypothetical protein
MALVVKDRVKVTTTTTGTGALALGSAGTGFQDFSVIGDGNETYYAITGGAQWEVGVGTYTASGATLSRDIVLASSDGGNKLSLAVGTKEVFVTLPAEKALTVTADAPPPNPTAGSTWYDTSSGVTYVYFEGLSGGQWVDTTPYMNTPNARIDLSSNGGAFQTIWTITINGGGAGHSNYPFDNSVDGGYGSDVSSAYSQISGGDSTTPYDLFGQAVDGGVAVNIT